MTSRVLVSMNGIGVLPGERFYTASVIIRSEEVKLQQTMVSYFVYQSECGDHRLQARHWVSVHWCKQTGQTPPVSKVFHPLPQVQNHLSSLRGDQPQSGQRMRGSEVPVLFSSSRSRTVELAGSSETALMLVHYGSVRSVRMANPTHRQDCDKIAPQHPHVGTS